MVYAIHCNKVRYSKGRMLQESNSWPASQIRTANHKCRRPFKGNLAKGAFSRHDFMKACVEQVRMRQAQNEGVLFQI